ncbi:MAG: hypothetical protein ACLQVD_09635 [Capsulimonadaceae bacterium]
MTNMLQWSRLKELATITLFIVLLCVNLPAPAATSPGSFTVSGDVRAAGAWDAARIARDLKPDIHLVPYSLKGHSHTAHCVPMLSLIEACKPAVNARIKHHELQFIVCVQGFDGYTVAFSMAELLPSIGNQKVWVALDEDGKPLVEEGGALQILVPGDVKPARWVHGITAITVTDTAKLSAH